MQWSKLISDQEGSDSETLQGSSSGQRPERFGLEDSQGSGSCASAGWRDSLDEEFYSDKFFAGPYCTVGSLKLMIGVHTKSFQFYNIGGHNRLRLISLSVGRVTSVAYSPDR